MGKRGDESSLNIRSAVVTAQVLSRDPNVMATAGSKYLSNINLRQSSVFSHFLHFLVTVSTLVSIHSV